MRHPALSATGLALAVALTLTACGGGEDADAASGPTSPTDSAFPRTVEHAMGSTEIPERPERVVVLDTGELDTALALGVTPVGAVTTAVSEEFLSYLAEDAAGIEVVGTIAGDDTIFVVARETVGGAALGEKLAAWAGTPSDPTSGQDTPATGAQPGDSDLNIEGSTTP